MTIDEFAQNIRKKRGLIVDWIEKGLIPGADIERDYIPDSAREPYTKCRAKKANSIYASIVKASNERKHVVPSLYGICDEEFNGYIDRLVEAELIVKRECDGIIYYDATMKSKENNKNFVLEAIKNICEGFAGGTTSSVLEKVAG